MEQPIRYCASCYYFNTQKQACMLPQTPFSSKDFCSKHVAEAVLCEICGRPVIVNKIIIEQDIKGNTHCYCSNCATYIAGCASCNQATCEFDSNPDPTPKVKTLRSQNGNQIFVSQIRNPEREAKFCHSCRCWNSITQSCQRDCSFGCSNKSDYWQDRQVVKKENEYQT